MDELLKLIEMYNRTSGKPGIDYKPDFYGESIGYIFTRGNRSLCIRGGISAHVALEKIVSHFDRMDFEDWHKNYVKGEK